MGAIPTTVKEKSEQQKYMGKPWGLRMCRVSWYNITTTGRQLAYDQSTNVQHDYVEVALIR